MNSQTCGILHSVHDHYACLQVNSITLAESVKGHELHYSLVLATSSCKSRPRTLNYKTHNLLSVDRNLKVPKLTSLLAASTPTRRERTVWISPCSCCVSRGRCCCATWACARTRGLARANPAAGGARSRSRDARLRMRLVWTSIQTRMQLLSRCCWA